MNSFQDFVTLNFFRSQLNYKFEKKSIFCHKLLSFKNLKLKKVPSRLRIIKLLKSDTNTSEASAIKPIVVKFGKRVYRYTDFKINKKNGTGFSYSGFSEVGRYCNGLAFKKYKKPYIEAIKKKDNMRVRLKFKPTAVIKRKKNYEELKYYYRKKLKVFRVLPTPLTKTNFLKITEIYFEKYSFFGNSLRILFKKHKLSYIIFFKKKPTPRLRKGRGTGWYDPIPETVKKKIKRHYDVRIKKICH